MAVTISGTNGIDKVQDGTIQSADFAAGVPARSNLPAGTVLQVVQGTYGTQVISTTNTYIDTGLAATITPTSSTSKILVLVSHPNSDKRNGDSYIQMRLLRAGSTVYTASPQFFYTGSTVTISAGIYFSYVDSPGTTSATEYKTQFANGNTGVGQVSVQQNSYTSTITLMEIAA